MDGILEMQTRWQKALKEARDISELAASEKREMTTEEEQKYRGWVDEAKKLDAKIEEEKKLSEMERKAAEVLAPDKPSAPAETPEQRAKVDEEKRMEGWRQWAKGGVPNSEFRALQADADTSGGFLKAPMTLVGDILKGVDDQLWIRGLATKYQVEGTGSLGRVSLDTDIEDGTWTAEVGLTDEDTAMAFGGRELQPHKLSKLLKVSNNLLRNPRIDVAALVVARMAYKFALTEEKGFLTGSGAQQPLGIFTASNNGISTSRDVSTGNSTTEFTLDGLINAKFSTKAQYHNLGQWMFHRDAIKLLLKLKDGNGQYLWRTDVKVGEPTTLFGNAVRMSENVPNTFTTGLYVGAFGDFSFYAIADSMDFMMQRLVERYAEYDQTGFIGRQWVDGMPVLEEAFARVTLA